MHTTGAIHPPAVSTSSASQSSGYVPCDRMLDYMVGYFLFAFLFFFSFLGFMARIQASLLFNIKFAKSLKRGRLLV